MHLSFPLKFLIKNIQIYLIYKNYSNYLDYVSFEEDKNHFISKNKKS